METRASPSSLPGKAAALIGAAHPGPTLAVTVVAALLAVAAGLDAGTAALLTVAVLAGQLTIGWSNDLLDAARDRQVHRSDKPLATGAVTVGTVRVALVVAAVGCVVLSLSLGWRSGLTHLVLGVGFGLAYNLGLKATVWSWLPYTVAFGALTAVVTLAATPPVLPPWWMAAGAATLGVSAHLLNALPDLADDAATGVQGLPHRLGARASQLLATVMLVAASVVVVLGPDGPTEVWAWAVLAVVLLLAAVVMRGRGKTPFRAAVLIALVDVTLLALLSREVR